MDSSGITEQCVSTMCRTFLQGKQLLSTMVWKAELEGCPLVALLRGSIFFCTLGNRALSVPTVSVAIVCYSLESFIMSFTSRTKIAIEAPEGVWSVSPFQECKLICWLEQRRNLDWDIAPSPPPLTHLQPHAQQSLTQWFAIKCKSDSMTAWEDFYLFLTWLMNQVRHFSSWHTHTQKVTVLIKKPNSLINT